MDFGGIGLGLHVCYLAFSSSALVIHSCSVTKQRQLGSVVVVSMHVTFQHLFNYIYSWFTFVVCLSAKFTVVSFKGN